MSDSNDGSLQQWLGDHPQERDDSAAFPPEDVEDYKLLFSLLEETPSAEAPAGFADRMVIRVEGIRYRCELLRSIIKSLLAISFVAALGYGILHMLKKLTGSPVFDRILDLKGGIAMAVLMVLLIQFMDEYFVKNKLLQSGQPRNA
ncbi:MAG: hypothetical protein QM733_24815 [Ilumatobacteraceae bacterium]